MITYAEKTRTSEVHIVSPKPGIYQCLDCCVAGAGDVHTTSPGLMLRHLGQHLRVANKTRQKLRRLHNQQYEEPQYVRYDLDLRTVTKEVLPRRCYFVLDLDNGNPELGRGYIWVARTKKALVALQQEHAAAPHVRTRLAGPWLSYALLTVLRGKVTP